MKKTNKRVSQVRTALDQLDKDDIYSLMLFALYKLRDMPEYLALSELCYVLDSDNLPKFLSFFGGMTLQVPTLKDMRLVLAALKIYQYVNIEHGDFEEALTASVTDEMSVDEVKDTYVKICEVMKNYEFGNKQDTLSLR